MKFIYPFYSNTKHPCFKTSNKQSKEHKGIMCSDENYNDVEEQLYDDMYEYVELLGVKRKPEYDKISDEIERYEKLINELHDKIHLLTVEDDIMFHENNLKIIDTFENRHPDLML